MENVELGLGPAPEDAENEHPGVSRRSLTKGLAWTVPAVGIGIAASAAPAFAASPFTCPDASCYRVPGTLGAAVVAGLPQPVSANLTNVTMVSSPITFNCTSQFGFLGGWTLWASQYRTSFTDNPDIVTNLGLTATTPSPLAIPITVPASTYIIQGWPWDKAGDGLLNIGQTNNHHITKICITYTAIFYGLGLPPVALGTCKFQVCYTTNAVLGNWNTITFTKASGPTPVP